MYGKRLTASSAVWKTSARSWHGGFVYELLRAAVSLRYCTAYVQPYGIFEHRSNRAIFFLRESDCPFDCFLSDILADNCVVEVDPLIVPWILISPLPPDSYLEP